MSNVVLEVQMYLQTCYSCSIAFAVPLEFDRKRRNDHSLFYCPAGHGQSYTGKSESEKAVEAAQLEARRAQARVNEAEHARLVAEKERDSAVRAKRKLERRVSKGVCPCCNRTFEDLARHMHTKHKDYALQPGKNAKQIEGPVQ